MMPVHDVPLRAAMGVPMSNSGPLEDPGKVVFATGAANIGVLVVGMAEGTTVVGSSRGWRAIVVVVGAGGLPVLEAAREALA